MRHVSSPLEVATFLRRSLFTIIALGGITLLNACSIWPKALSFSSEPDSAPAVVVAPAPAEPAPVVVTPLEAQTSAVATPVVASAEMPSTSSMAEPAKAEPAATPVATAPQQPTQAALLVPGFYINVGLFAVPANGSNAFKKLEGAGLPVFSDPVATQRGTLTRVRVGPFTKRAEATAAVKKIKALKLDAVIFKH